MLGVTPAVAADGDLSTPAFANEYNPADYYTLTRVDAAGDNTITKFEYNSATQAFTPVYYRVDLTQTNFGNPAGDTTLTFGWQKNSNGSIEFVENPTNPVGQQITYTYDSSIPNNTQNIYIGNNGGTGIFDSNTEDISGDFINNSSWHDSGSIVGSCEIGNISGLFIGNKSTAISEPDVMGNISGIFIGNSSGVIKYTSGYSPIIKNISGVFIGNSGIVLDVLKVESIEGDFIFNNGGAIRIDSNYNNGTTSIKGNFIGNSSSSGGAIFSGYHSGIANIAGNFTANNVNRTSGDALGGAIANTSDNYGRVKPDIDTISAEFNNNYTYATDGNSYGGAIFNKAGTISEIINSKFIGNYSKTEKGNSIGGAIYHTAYRKTSGVFGSIGKYDDFTEELSGGIINSSFYNNYAESFDGRALGGGIYTDFSLNIIAKDGGESVFSGNYTVSNGVKTPNAIYLDVSPEIKRQNQLVSIDTTSVTTADITTKAVPTLILDASTNGVIQFDDPIDGAQGTTETVTTTADLNVAERYQDDYGSTVEEFLESVKPYWYDQSMTDEEIILTGYRRDYLEAGDTQQVTTETTNSAYSLNITGDETGKVILNNDVTAHTYDADGKETGTAPVNISLEKTNLYLGARDDVFNGNNLDLKSGFMSMVNDAAGVSALNSLTISGNTNFVADVDLAAKEMDRFTASEYGSHTGNLNVVGMNLLSDANMDEDVTAIYFAEPGLKNNVVNAVGELPGAYQTAYTPIYKYNFIYDTENEYDGKGDGGYFIFTRGDKIPVLPDPDPEPEPDPEPDEPDVPVIPTPPQGGGSTGNPSDAFNPSVLATPVANLAAGQAAVNEAFKYVFEHADAFTQLPAMERYAKINANKYALSTDFNDNLPEYAEQLHNNAVWFRPYTTFESMNLDNGPKVDAITYGSLVGFDGDFKEMKNGWHRVFTGYAGYMGSSLNYSGVDTSMNGGLLGFTETFYKGNFWTAITASAGASVGESHTMYGKEDYTSLLAGVGSKTGYNFEFKDGKFIIQPIMYLSYTFVNTFDYKNAAGVSIESDPLHTIQLNPSVRFIANLKGGWQPYASVGMVWNLMNESKVTANNVKLPEMSVKPYVEYGVGVQRNWADKFTAFLQAMIRNGGRNGIALTGGFRFMLGSDDNNDKPKVKKEIKSL